MTASEVINKSTNDAKETTTPPENKLLAHDTSGFAASHTVKSYRHKYPNHPEHSDMQHVPLEARNHSPLEAKVG